MAIIANIQHNDRLLSRSSKVAATQTVSDFRCYWEHIPGVLRARLTALLKSSPYASAPAEVRATFVMNAFALIGMDDATYRACFDGWRKFCLLREAGLLKGATQPTMAA